MEKKELEITSELVLDFDKRGGLIPVVVQDYLTLEIVMLGYLNQQAFDATLESKIATFWSTSRNELWVKGKTSGDYLAIKDILIDCDQDAVIFKVELVGGGACHTKNSKGSFRKSCFYRQLQFNDHNPLLKILEE